MAYGDAARNEARLSIESLRHHMAYPVAVVGERVDGARHIPFPQRDKGGRWAKVNLDLLSPFQSTLYLDADTRVYGDLSAGFAVLDDGWHVAITPSTQQGGAALWHVSQEERDQTEDAYGMRPLQLQGGAIFFRRCEEVSDLFSAWRAAWLEREGQDQGALLRALWHVPIKAWLLGRDWNGGRLVGHFFGRAARG